MKFRIGQNLNSLMQTRNFKFEKFEFIHPNNKLWKNSIQSDLNLKHYIFYAILKFLSKHTKRFKKKKSQKEVLLKKNN